MRINELLVFVYSCSNSCADAGQSRGAHEVPLPRARLYAAARRRAARPKIKRKRIIFY